MPLNPYSSNASRIRSPTPPASRLAWSMAKPTNRPAPAATMRATSRLANREVARIVAAGAGRFVGFAMLHARRDAGGVGDLIREAFEEYGFRGIKVHRP